VANRAPRAGDVINDAYVLRREIGRGSMGVVFEAYQLEGQRRVAVKMLLPDAMNHATVVDRFIREARMASSLSHPHLVDIYAFGIEPAPFLVMEFLEGEDLRDYLGRRGVLSLEETVAVMEQTLDAVGYAHQQGIVHRDLKPENIYLAVRAGQDRIVKVLDFGIAKAVTSNWGSMVERLTGTGMACGTPHYMAPEQLRGIDDIRAMADVYSLGCLIYELLTGMPPFDGKSPVDIAVKHVEKAPPSLPAVYSGTHIEYVVFRALAKDAPARFPDALAMLAELRRSIDWQVQPEVEDERLEWGKVTVKVPDGVDMVRQYRERERQRGAIVQLPPGVPPHALQSEPDTDPAHLALETEPATDPAAPLAQALPPASPHLEERTIPVPRIAALPEGESLEEFKRRVGGWHGDARPGSELSALKRTDVYATSDDDDRKPAARPSANPSANPSAATPATRSAADRSARAARKKRKDTTWIWVTLVVIVVLMALAVLALTGLILFRVV